MDSNPLKQYFRQPAIYIRLPSQGRFWPRDTLDMPPNGELAVLPMTTMDEITYRTPDALFNGSAVVSVVQSCCPNILDAWHMPSTDIDTVLVAIRIATYGHEMDVSTRCPACETEADYGVDLRRVMEEVSSPDYSKPLQLGDLEIWFRPMSYANINANNLQQFEDQKMLASMQEAEIDDATRARQLGEILKKITEITTVALAQNIAAIKTPTAQVTETDMISDWLQNVDRNMFNSVRDHVIELRRKGEIKPLHIRCGNCGHEHEQAFTMDMTTFFGDAS